MMLLRLKFLTCFLMIFALGGGVANAFNFEKLVMPGKVIEGHKKYEEDCDKCHEAFNKKFQRRLCLDCHKKVAKDIQEKTGFHGKSNEVGGRECKFCHSDHLGRSADIVQFNKDRFNHDLSDFKLEHSHRGIACKSCHRPKKLYREASHECYACHKNNDIHNGKLGKKCKDCHSAKGWSENKFDHSKTDYPLTGKHKKTNCALCHPRNKYKDVSDKCQDCHRINDVHDGDLGNKCQNCHSTLGWQSKYFDHDKKTDYKLRGKHKKARCNSCHLNDDYKKELKTDCYSCHKKQDIHKKELGKKCEQCHNETSWKEKTFKHKDKSKTPCFDCHKVDDVHKQRYGKKCKDCHGTKEWSEAKFDHDKDTDFRLHGKHKDVGCELCHPGDVKDEKDKTACIDCHALEDIHQNKLGEKCGKCHNENGWRMRIKFDHDLTKYPLLGLHATTPCEECHFDAKYRDTTSKCFNCHESDDEHKLSLGKKCGVCHNPNSWVYWRYDHDKTDFKLQGAHEDLVCHACHREPMLEDSDIGVSCIDCHQVDDIHDGNFGKRCERCHNQRDFREIDLWDDN